MNEKILLKIKELPTDPGVYIMRDAEGTVIYVGKARNLKNRVRSYFNSSLKTEKTYALVEKIEDFDYILAKSEVDALVLENTLIKKYKPHYNILLKDDKLYPFLRIGVKEPFPSVRIIRRLKPDGAKYFGPYMIGITTKDMLDLLHTAFPIRWCEKEIGKTQTDRPCLYYQLGKCLAPCHFEEARAEYGKMINKVIDFLNGNDKEIREILLRKMQFASDNLDFESAIEYKKRIETLDKMVRSQIVAIPRELESDVFGFAFGDVSHAVAVMTVRGGKVIAMEKFALPGVDKEDGIVDFIYQYYQTHPMLAEEIVLSEEGDYSVLQSALSQIGKAKIIVPKMGIRKQLSEMADNNASEYLSRSSEIISRKDKMTVGATKQLANVLSMNAELKRIECYDISHISGTDKVASMVVFTDGEKDGDMYRRFKIKTVEGSNDFACMKETLLRRLNRLIENKDPSFSVRPDLIIIDGGIGQVEYALQAEAETGVHIPMIGLAKREETIVLPDGREISLSKDSFALRLIQRIRDEAHRFAITYHRKLRDKRTLESKLKQVKGIGDATVKKLFARFKSMEGIRKAEIVELEEVVSSKVAKDLYAFLHDNGEI